MVSMVSVWSKTIRHSTQVGMLLLVTIVFVLVKRKNRSLLGVDQSSVLLAADQQHAGGALVDNQLTIDETKYAVFGERSNSTPPSTSSVDRYLNYVRSHIVQPSRTISTVPLSSAKLAEFGSIVDKKLKGRRNGFFIECGAADGHSYSHSLFLELERNWTGLLVEANQRYFREILGLNRNAYVFGGCLSPLRRPRQLRFKAAGDQGGLMKQLSPTHQEDIASHESYEATYLVQCFPLNDLLAAIGVNHVDFFTLDVQGAEVPILATIDFRAVRIDIVLVEVYDRSPKRRDNIEHNVRAIFKQSGLYRDGVQLGYDIMFERLDPAIE